MIFPSSTAQLLDRSTFPPPHTPLDCAVSGGPDSLCLLALSVAAGCDVTAYHVDHGLREGSSKEADVVADAAQRLGATFVALEVQLAPGPNLEARARAARFAALPEGAATGHTMDDQAETVVLNLLRGSGLDGLRGMRPGFQHPILGLRREETESYVAALGLDPVRDPSNSDLSFLRNRVRHELLPMLAELASRDLIPVLARQAALVGEEAELLDELAGAIDPTDVVALRAAPLALRRRALRRFARAVGDGAYPPDAAAIERLLEVVAGTRLATELPGGQRIARSHGRLIPRERHRPER